MEYSLEGLSKTFVAHAESAEKQRLDMIDRWKDEWSSDKIPEHMQDTFNLPQALLSLVQEIDKLKRDLASANQLINMIVHTAANKDE